jgi:hypothetical protein
MPTYSRNPSDDGRIWERQPGETDSQWLAFKAYREINPSERSITEAYRRRTGKASAMHAGSHYYEMAKRWAWNDRARAYDEHMDRLSIEAEVEERNKIRRLRRVTLVQAMSKLREAIPQLDFTKLSGNELARLMEVVTRNLREEYADQPVQRQQTELTVVDGGASEFAKLAQRAQGLTDTELVAQYRRLAQRAERPGGGSALTEDILDGDDDGDQG